MGGGSDSKVSAYNADTQVWFLGREDPLEKEWQPTPVLLPGKSHGGKSLVGYSPWGPKELDTTERLHFLSFLVSISVWSLSSFSERQINF